MLARLLSICLLATWVGCGKAPSSSPTPPEQEAVAADAATAPSTEGGSPSRSLPAEANDEAQIASTLGELTQAVRKFSVEQRRTPKDLEELVTNGYLSQLPQSPTGKRFAITKNLQVVLSDL